MHKSQYYFPYLQYSNHQQKHLHKTLKEPLNEFLESVTKIQMAIYLILSWNNLSKIFSRRRWVATISIELNRSFTLTSKRKIIKDLTNEQAWQQLEVVAEVVLMKKWSFSNMVHEVQDLHYTRIIIKIIITAVIVKMELILNNSYAYKR